MTNVTFKLNKGIIYGLEVKGHAKFNTNGEDILCSSISMATQSCVNFVRKKVERFTICINKVDAKTGYLLFEIANKAYANDVRVQAAFELTYDGLKALSEDDEFKDYIKIEVKEDVRD